MKQDQLFDKTTKEIVAAIESGKLERWESPYTKRGLARNFFTGNHYSGINFLTFNFLNDDRVKLYGTLKQITEAGGCIKDGAIERYAVFASVVFKHNGKTVEANLAAQLKKQGKKVDSFFFYREYPVYTLADVDGIKFETEIEQGVKHHGKGFDEMNKLIIEKSGITVVHENQFKAYYNRVGDYINMPNPENMVEGSYPSTLAHEGVHATGAKHRLNRDTLLNSKEKGDQEYSQEELVAEIGSAFLCAHLGIENLNQSAAYIKYWLQPLKNDSSLIFKAAAAAQKAVNYILK
jgi:antirestriction protein ArdC